MATPGPGHRGGFCVMFRAKALFLEGLGRMGPWAVGGWAAYFEQNRFGSILRIPALKSRPPTTALTGHTHPDRDFPIAIHYTEML